MRLSQVLPAPAAIALVAAIATPAGASTLSFNLFVSVPVRCHVSDVRALDAEQGTVRVEASCNAATFRLVFGGDLAVLPIQSASAVDATVVPQGNALLVRPVRPGAFVIDVDYGSDLGTVESAFADIEAR